MSLYPVADLQTHAGELAQRLISLRDFSSAAHELLATVRTLASDLVRRHTKKIVTLVEISRFTLTRAGINLYEFAYCRPEMREYKSVYFDILRALRERQADIDQDAVECTRLFLSLSPPLGLYSADSRPRPQVASGDY
ncbi:hypothetical protein DENSPDRAFT_840733 [Dentipellis sp. KUC8613]|nr:hypothetical protein DENSPDRAFT_840733 [Dentipellis sp. KUC8613]